MIDLYFISLCALLLLAFIALGVLIETGRDIARARFAERSRANKRINSPLL